MTNKSVKKGVKSMSEKAASWSQVCKQLSGIGGYVDCDGEKVRPLELMQKLGVHVAKNSYKPADIFGAWSARMKANKVCQIVKSVSVKIKFGGVERTLYTKGGENQFTAIRQQELCNLVSAADKIKGSTDVVVSAANVLRGLYQSAYIDTTVAALKKSQAKAAEVSHGWVNVKASSKEADNWIEVRRDKNGVWSEVEAKVVKVEVKRGRGRKAA